MSQRATPSNISFSKEYEKKSAVRSRLQELIESSIFSGEVSTKEELDSLLSSLQLSLDALKMIPLEVYQKKSNRLK